MIHSYMERPPPADEGDFCPRSNKFVGEAFGPPNIRVVFAGAEQDSKNREDRIILLLGGDREEKAGIIDVLCNFFYGVDKDDQFRCHIADEKFDASTPTKAVICYVFNESRMSFRPIVVDVKDGDKEMLAGWLEQNPRLRIDLVCVLINSNGRLPHGREESLHQMLSLLPSWLHSNLVVLLTNWNGGAPPLPILRRLSLQDHPAFKMNWSTLFQRKHDDSLKEFLRANFWEMSESSFDCLVERLQSLPPQSYSGLEPEPPRFRLLLQPENGSESQSSSSSSTWTSVIEKTSEDALLNLRRNILLRSLDNGERDGIRSTSSQYDLPPPITLFSTEKSTTPRTKVSIFQTSSSTVEDRIVDKPPAGLPSALQTSPQKIIVDETISVKLVGREKSGEGRDAHFQSSAPLASPAFQLRSQTFRSEDLSPGTARPSVIRFDGTSNRAENEEKRIPYQAQVENDSSPTRHFPLHGQIGTLVDVVGHSSLQETHYVTKTFVNGALPHHERSPTEKSSESSPGSVAMSTRLHSREPSGRRVSPRPIGDSPSIRYLYDEESRSHFPRLDEAPNRLSQLLPLHSPNPPQILTRRETVIEEPFYENQAAVAEQREEVRNGVSSFLRNGIGRMSRHKRKSSGSEPKVSPHQVVTPAATIQERYQHIRSPCDLRSPGVVQSPSMPTSIAKSPEMVRREKSLRRAGENILRESRVSGASPASPAPIGQNNILIPQSMRQSHSPIVVSLHMSQKGSQEDVGRTGEIATSDPLRPRPLIHRPRQITAEERVREVPVVVERPNRLLQGGEVSEASSAHQSSLVKREMEAQQGRAASPPTAQAAPLATEEDAPPPPPPHQLRNWKETRNEEEKLYLIGLAPLKSVMSPSQADLSYRNSEGGRLRVLCPLPGPAAPWWHWILPVCCLCVAPVFLLLLILTLILVGVLS